MGRRLTFALLICALTLGAKVSGMTWLWISVVLFGMKPPFPHAPEFKDIDVVGSICGEEEVLMWDGTKNRFACLSSLDHLVVPPYSKLWGTTRKAHT